MAAWQSALEMLCSALRRRKDWVRPQRPSSLALTETRRRFPPLVTTRSYQGLSRPAWTRTSKPQRANWAAAMPSAPTVMGQDDGLLCATARSVIHLSLNRRFSTVDCSTERPSRDSIERQNPIIGRDDQKARIRRPLDPREVRLFLIQDFEVQSGQRRSIRGRPVLSFK